MQRRNLMLSGAGLLAAGAAMPAAAQAVTRWDISIPWGPSEFHTINAARFAREAAAVTNNQVLMTVHAGGSLGVRANESVRAVADGVVPMAEFASFQNIGEIPILGIDALPFLISSQAELRIMSDLIRPIWAAELARRGVTPLYMVPWPTQNLYFKRPVANAAELRGIRMRTMDRNTTEMSSRLGMVGQQLNNPDVVPALASGRVDAVMTSATTAVAQRYWEFLRYAYTTNHLWATNMMVVSTEALRRLSPAHRTAITELATKLEPEFWAVAQAEHETRAAELRANGMTVEAPPEALIAPMREATRTMIDDFIRTNPAAGPVITEFRRRVGRV
jgi:TRAP-type C4-dicarboxylate transport system substrate-binding protein